MSGYYGSIARVRDWLRSKNDEVRDNCFQYSSGDFNDMANDLDSADRRERIATAALQGLCSGPPMHGDGWKPEFVAAAVVGLADALIAELDK